MYKKEIKFSKKQNVERKTWSILQQVGKNFKDKRNLYY